MASVLDLFTRLDEEDVLTLHSNMMKTLTISKNTRFLNYDISFLNDFYKDEKPVGDLLPYSEICNFCDDIKNNRKPRVKVKLDPKDFMLKSWSSAIANGLVQIGSQERMGTGTIYKDDTIIRLSNVTIDETGAVTLHCQKAKYSDQVKSNLSLILRVRNLLKRIHCEISCAAMTDKNCPRYRTREWPIRSELHAFYSTGTMSIGRP